MHRNTRDDTTGTVIFFLRGPNKNVGLQANEARRPPVVPGARARARRRARLCAVSTERPPSKRRERVDGRRPRLHLANPPTPPRETGQEDGPETKTFESSSRLQSVRKSKSTENEQETENSKSMIETDTGK